MLLKSEQFQGEADAFLVADSIVWTRLEANELRAKIN